MNPTLRTVVATAVGMFLCFRAGKTHTHSIPMDFDQIAHDAGAVYTATVVSLQSEIGPGGNAIFTRAELADVDWISPTKTREPAVHALRYLGGSWNGLHMRTCMTPALAVGARCVFFEEPGSDNDAPAVSPTVGSAQGLFLLKQDGKTGVSFPLRGGRAVLGVESDELILPDPVERIESGKVIARALSGIERFTTLPISSIPGSAIAALPAASSAAPLDYAAFRSLIMAKRSAKRASPSVLGVTTTNAAALPAKEYDGGFGSIANWSRPAQKDGGTCACGYHRLPITMEMEPRNSWLYGIDNALLFHFNQYMDIFRVIDSDGTYGPNDANEFCGFPPSGDLNAIFGFDWGASTLGMAITYYDGDTECGEIYESDVAFNPAYAWTSSPTAALSDPKLNIYRSTANHELGHVWGNQRGKAAETYDYGVPTIMHGSYQPASSGVYETG